MIIECLQKADACGTKKAARGSFSVHLSKVEC
jgi:hypothetical protein